MEDLEKSERWPEILEKVDEVPLKDLADQVGVSPGELAAALKRTETARKPRATPGTVPNPPKSVRRASRKARQKTAERPKTAVPGGEPPQWWSDVEALKDDLSISDMAARIGVSPGAIAAEFKRQNTVRTPVKVEHPQKERAPRARAKKTAREAAAPAPAPAAAPATPTSTARGRSRRPRATTGAVAWQVTLRDRGNDNVVVVLAGDVVEAAEKARKATGTVVGILRIGDVLD